MSRMRCLAASVIAASACATGVAAAQSPPGGPPFEPKDAAAARKIALQNRAVRLINETQQHVYKAMAGCKPSVPHGRATPTHDAPSQAILDLLAPLRRPVTPADADAKPSGITPWGGQIYLDYARTVRSANGQALTIIVSRYTRPSFRPSDRCLNAIHARLVKLAASQPSGIRRYALREFDRLRKAQAKAPAEPAGPQDGVFLFSRGGGGGGASAAELATRGMFFSAGGARRGGATLNGLLPDGVATVTLKYPKRVSRGPYYKPTVFPRAFSRTVHVHDNVISLHVTRAAMDAFPHRMIWRDSGGRIIRTVTARL
jgi:hypothetical protein